MLKNYIKIALRNLWKSKIFSTINILGLAIGIAASFMMFMIVFQEISYDQHIHDKERIGRIICNDTNFKLINAEAPLPLADILKENFSEIEKVARTYRMRIDITINKTNFGEKGIYFIDPELVDLLSIKIINGNMNTFSSLHNAVLLSESEAKRLFPNGDCLGKAIDIENYKKKSYQLTVAGVYEDISELSTFNSDLLISMNLGERVIDDIWKRPNQKSVLTNWFRTVVGIYMKFSDTDAIPKIEEQLVDIVKNNVPETVGRKLSIQMLPDIYFGSNNLDRNSYPTGDITKTILFTIISLLILLIASLNYIVLTTAKSIKRNKEIGIRKVIGATRKSILFQVILESNIIAIVALPLAYLIYSVCLIPFTELLQIEFHQTIYNSSLVFLSLVGLTFFIASLTGIFISINLSRQNPIDLFKRKINIKHSRFQLRQVFVATEIIIVVALLFSIIVVKEQIHFFRNKDMGFDKTNLFVIQINNEDWQNKYDVIKNELLALPPVKNVTAAMELPPMQGAMLFRMPKYNNPDEEITMNGMAVDYDFLETFDIKLLEGRGFSKEFPTDSAEACLMNETAIKELGLGGVRELYEGRKKIVGIIKDINFRSLRSKISPMVIEMSQTKYLNEIVVKIDGQDLINSVDKIKKTIESIVPGAEYETHFYDERIDDLYNDELNFASILDISTGLAVFITCLGLFGLTIFIAEQRTKEIGIRKVMGASVSNIVKMISKEFVLLVIVGVVIASPITYYLMNKWLENFAYKIEIGFGTVFLAAAIALVITLFTVSIQAVKAAIANPVESLRDK